MKGGSKIRNADVPFVDFEEKDGVVTVSFRSVRESRFHTGGYLESFTAENEIKTVKLAVIIGLTIQYFVEKKKKDESEKDL